MNRLGPTTTVRELGDTPLMPRLVEEVL